MELEHSGAVCSEVRVLLAFPPRDPAWLNDSITPCPEVPTESRLATMTHARWSGSPSST